MKKLLVVCVAAMLGGCSLLSEPVCVVKSDAVVMKITDSKLAAVLHFADGKADLSKKDLKTVQEVAEQAAQSGANVVVYGHASHRTRTKDPIQHMIVNIEVSNDRAVNTAQALMKAGVPAEKINNIAMFDSRPVRKEITRADEAANRRAEIYLYKYILGLPE